MTTNQVNIQILSQKKGKKKVNTQIGNAQKKYNLKSNSHRDQRWWEELEPPVPLPLPCHRHNLTADETKPP